MQCPVIHIVSDGKPGHLAQSRGLADAIARRLAVQVVEHDASGATDRAAVGDQAGGTGGGLVLAAGRRAYRPALRFKRTAGLVAVALMDPGWWQRRRFDLCVIPKHDGVAERGNVIVTEGALNGVEPATQASPEEGLILIGGPSKHHGWQAGAVERQVEAILERDASMRWTATDSRRTPQATRDGLQALAAQSGGRLAYCPATQTPRGWVAQQLQRCGVCWVTEDSVSMVYEALSAGARVGLLPVKRKTGRPGRVVRGVDGLIERGWVGTFADWSAGGALPAERPPLAEADRVASLIIERWFKTQPMA